jgi:ABC-type glutathione transport system ATPase component
MIKINGVTKSYGALKAVDNVDLQITKGGSLGLVGESGSGKTTLARLILKLIAPDTGSIEYDGITDLRRECQIVFQDPQTSLNPRIRIGEAIGEPVLIHNLMPKKNIPGKVAELLRLVKLPPDHASRYPHELSGGERQRVGIARALASNPKFIILDEPVSALDVSIQIDILRLLLEIKKDLALTYLFIAHDLNVVGFMCDRIAVMQQGKIIEEGLSANVLKRPKTDYAKKLIGSTLPI